MTKEHYIKVSIDEKIAIITIDREKQLNALNKALIQELSVSLEGLETHKGVRVVILIGKGQKSFVAGADIKEFSKYSPKEGEEMSKYGQRVLFDKIENFKKPIIAAINGYALGGGLELALACHMRIASNFSKMGLPECSLGIIPGYGGTQRLIRTVGRTVATEMILTGKIIDAKEAEKVGLISCITPHEETLDLAKKLAKSCMKNSPKSLESAIKCINQNFDSKGLSFEQKEFGKLFGTNEFNEGVSAFLEKRKPNY